MKATITLLVMMAIWTLLAWGATGLLSGLTELSRMADNDITQLPPSLREGLLLLVPQAELEVWLPRLVQLWRGLMVSFPMLVSLLGFAVWVFWGAGMLVLLVLTVVVRRIMASSLPHEGPG